MTTFATLRRVGRGLPLWQSLILVIAFAALASADTGRVLVNGALVWRGPGTGPAFTQLGLGTTVEIVRRVGDWYEIVLPASSGPVRIGYVRATQIDVVQRGPLSAEARQLAAAAPRVPAATPSRYLNADIGVRYGDSDFARTATAFADRYAEDGSIATSYGNGSGPEFDIMLTQMLGSRFGVGGGLSVYSRGANAEITGTVPHPFYFDQHRIAVADAEDVETADGTSSVAKLKGSEIGIHIPLSYVVKSSSRMRIAAYGGPSIFLIRQDVVTNVDLDDPYPHDEVAIDGYTAEEMSATLFGFHVGADFSYFMSSRYGVGAGIRYRTATIEFDDDTATTDGKAGGGLQVSGGLRIRF